MFLLVGIPTVFLVTVFEVTCICEASPGLKMTIPLRQANSVASTSMALNFAMMS